MKTMKKQVWGLAAGAFLGLSAMSSVVHSDPISFIKGPFEFKFTDFEFASAPANGVNVGGIFSLASINPDGSSVPWWVPASFVSPISDGTMLNGFFSNITITSGANPAFTATGGLLVVYNVPFGDYNPSTFPTMGINPTVQLCGGVACPTPWLTELFVPGIAWPPDNTTTLAGNFAGTNPINGDGSGYLSVANLGGRTVTNGNGGANFVLPASFVGTDNAHFDTNGFTFTGVGAPAPADMLLGSHFFQCGFANSPSGCSQVGNNSNTAASDDPVRGSVVPEPGTLALLGISTLGLALAGRRRKG